MLEVDTAPFTAHQPKITLASSIGNGVSFLNKNLSAKMFGPSQNAAGTQLMLDFLRGFKHNGSSLLLSQRVNNVSKLRHGLLRAERLLDRHEDEEPIDRVAGLDELGFLPGWGDTVGRVRESFQLLLDIIQAPDAETLERFLARLPLVFKVVILSPHGYFGQHNVLGMPDTGGQVSEPVHAICLSLSHSRLSTWGKVAGEGSAARWPGSGLVYPTVIYCQFVVLAFLSLVFIPC